MRDYGNRMGIPTANGAVYFDDRFVANPLVFCGTVGLIPKDKVEKEVKPGDLVVSLGGRTGRDGIHGATFSSAALEEGISSRVVQIGHAIMEKRTMDFSYAETFAGVEAADGYERLIHDAMVGDATLFIRSDEVQQAWRIVDPYLQAWSEPGGAMHPYPAGTWGPHMADLLVERSGDEWRNPVHRPRAQWRRLTELPQ